MKRLRPNSPEWLAELANTNPQQAPMTRAIVDAAGSQEVCSICGDTPAKDYEKPGVALLVRLCDDCRRIQGGQFIPVPGDASDDQS